jgi:hypothetical protein
MKTSSPFAAAYGGAGWSPRTASLRQEMGDIWGPWGVASEWGPLRAVLLHRPGVEIEGLADPDAAQMLAPVDPAAMRRHHDALAEAYRRAGMTIHYLEPSTTPPPNTLLRPASTVRAGEERHVARRLAELGLPILRSVRGSGTFEGADALWVDEKTVLLATGLRTNAEGAAQVESLLREMGVEVIRVGLPSVTWPWPGQGGCPTGRQRPCGSEVMRCCGSQTKRKPGRGWPSIL